MYEFGFDGLKWNYIELKQTNKLFRLHAANGTDNGEVAMSLGEVQVLPQPHAAAKRNTLWKPHLHRAWCTDNERAVISVFNSSRLINSKINDSNIEISREQIDDDRIRKGIGVNEKHEIVMFWAKL